MVQKVNFRSLKIILVSMNAKFAKLYMYLHDQIKIILMHTTKTQVLQNIGLQLFIKRLKKVEEKCYGSQKQKIIKDKIEFFSLKTDMIIDIGGGYGTFIEEFLKISNIEHIVIEPSEHLSKICHDKGLRVITKFLEEICEGDLPKIKKTFVSFELFEHLHDPKIFLEILNDLMDSGDSFIFTTLSGMGVDIQTLWEDSKQYHHLCI